MSPTFMNQKMINKTSQNAPNTLNSSYSKYVLLIIQNKQKQVNSSNKLYSKHDLFK
jgi:hypothetical protein